jgi:hypothetical protein
MLRATVIVCGILLGLLLAAMGIASTQTSVWEGLCHVAADPWGIVTLMDLGVGIIFVAVWMTIVEPRPLYAGAWIVALFLLGNAVTLIFLIWRTRYARRISDLFLPSRRNDSTMP